MTFPETLGRGGEGAVEKLAEGKESGASAAAGEPWAPADFSEGGGTPSMKKERILYRVVEEQALPQSPSPAKNTNRTVTLRRFSWDTGSLLPPAEPVHADALRAILVGHPD